MSAPGWCFLDEPGGFGLGVGIEDTFIRDESVAPPRRRLDEYELTGHDVHWREDLTLVARSGAGALRWGVPWWRVEPALGRFDFSWTDEVAAEMDRLGLVCVVDVLHYGTPDWLAGSFVDPTFPVAFERYAEALATRYGSRWRWWTPVNEPMIAAIWCGRDGRWPPHLTGDDGFARVLGGVVAGAQRATRAIRRAAPEARILHVEAGFRWEGGWPTGRAALDEWRFLATDLITGRLPDEGMIGYLAAAGLERRALEELVAGGVGPDVMGFNYYPGFTTAGWVGEGERARQVEAGTVGLVELARAFAERYGLPLALTETSRISADPGPKIAWLRELLETVRGPLADLDLRGAFWFPFLDMVDWDYRESGRPMEDHLLPFGLVGLEREPDGDLRRVPNAALEAFAELAGGPPREE